MSADDRSTRSDDDSEQSSEAENKRLLEELTSFYLLGMETKSDGKAHQDQVKTAVKAQSDLIKKIIRKHIWRTTKFVTKPAQITRLINQVWEHMPSTLKNLEGHEAKWKDSFGKITPSILC